MKLKGIQILKLNYHLAPNPAKVALQSESL